MMELYPFEFLSFYTYPYLTYARLSFYILDISSKYFLVSIFLHLKKDSVDYVMNSTKKIHNINKTLQPKTLIHLNNQICPDEQKCSSLNQNIFLNQPNAVKK